MLSIIHDGDHGGDDFVTTLMFAGYPEFFKLLGVTTNAGNANPLQAAHNAACALGLAGRHDVPVIPGSPKSIKGLYKLGDDAFGSDGLGGIDLPDDLKPATVLEQDAVKWIADRLQENTEAITICATGPLTNIAHLLVDYPHLKQRIKSIIIMGGGINPAGNIKPYAEFNFYMDPDAADIVLTSGVPIVLHTLDTTHSAVYTKARQQAVRALAGGSLPALLDRIMRITEALEQKSFGSEGSFFHDHQVCGYLMMPDNYEVKKVRARVSASEEDEAGRLHVEEDENGSVSLVTRHKDTDRFFASLLEALRRLPAMKEH